MVELATRLPAQRVTDAEGLPWMCRDSGAPGPVLVLLPGAAAGGDIAYRLVEALGAQWRTVSVTYPSGASARQLADGLAELLDRLGIDRAAVWGSSYGAWWAQAFASRHGHRLTGLWLANAFVDGCDVAHLPLFSLDWLRASDAVAVQQRWLQAIAQRPPGALRDELLHALLHTLSADDLRARLIEVARAEPLPVTRPPCDVVVSDCADDPVLDAACRERMVNRYPHARHIAFQTGGHYPHLSEHATVLAALQPWLADIAHQETT